MAKQADIKLPAYGLKAVSLLEAGGFEAWCVGGFVRDALRGVPAHDVDIACSAPWQETAGVLRQAGCAVHETGTAFGTVTAVVDGHPIEITSFRSDGAYRDGRHPAEVRFVESIDQDLARRDFTVNALAFHPQRGLHDPFGGQADLEQGIIRTVGRPEERFAEDALRILRGLRLAAQMGFSIEAATAGAMRDQAPLLDKVSAERIFHEFQRLLLGPAAGTVLAEHWQVLRQVVPELADMAACPQHNPYHCYDVLVHSAHVVDASPAEPRSRWAALFHDSGKPACRTTDAAGIDHFKGHAAFSARIAHDTLTRLKAPGRLVDEVSLLVLHHEDYHPDTDACVLRALRRMNGDAQLYRCLLDLQMADSAGKPAGVTERADQARAAAARLERLLRAEVPFTRGQLAVDGNALLEAGWKPGPALGRMLDALLDEVMEGRLPNDRSELLAYASAHMER